MHNERRAREPVHQRGGCVGGNAPRSCYQKLGCARACNIEDRRSTHKNDEVARGTKYEPARRVRGTILKEHIVEKRCVKPRLVPQCLAVEVAFGVGAWARLRCAWVARGSCAQLPPWRSRPSGCGRSEAQVSHPLRLLIGRWLLRDTSIVRALKLERCVRATSVSECQRLRRAPPSLKEWRVDMAVRT